MESGGTRLLLDVGTPLDVDDGRAELPSTLGQVGDVVGIVVSHPHMDHYGLVRSFSAEVPVLIGESARAILEAAKDFTPSGASFANTVALQDRKTIELGAFRITPYLVDHSAYDSYAILVEADGNSLFYTGDLRGHGRKSSLFERLLRSPPRADALLMEGTTATRQGTDKGFDTETDLESRLAEICRTTPGIVLLWCSGQNIDRLVTAFRAAKRSGRQLVLDMYTAHILDATGNPNVPHADWDGSAYSCRRARRSGLCRTSRSI